MNPDPEQPQQTSNQKYFPQGFFEALGEEKIRELVKIFYSYLIQSSLRPMFPDDIQESEIKAADFMIQVMGGPKYYLEKRGPARMRARHLPFAIDEKARKEWMSCYRQALDDIEMSEENKNHIWNFLEEQSRWMVNR
ncbi:MAG: bacitracin resistance protein BacA [Leptospiraceae bacterium]|nr:bacitracin resistance protein BacA [Leptospiraceae bacterium]MCP5513091.1 bacitracin resistance protein BacA [Leptospiraceae bacterium]